MNSTNHHLPVSIVIPTYGRERVLVESIENLLDLKIKAAEIIVVDQSKKHEQQTTDQLEIWQKYNQIRVITLPKPSIPHAMNTGLLHASYSIVLFLDDDIKAHEDLVEVHYQAHQENPNRIIAGKVIQPWDKQDKFSDDGHQFNSDEKGFIKHFMGGNFSIDKKNAVDLGGFDENFIGVAYRFEKEFADRWLTAGNKILFEPQAVIDHLKVTRGGTREYGEHLTTIHPHHAVGAYYYILISAKIENKTKQIYKRLMQSIKTRHHLKRPWYIPVTLIAELRGLLKAFMLRRIGPKHI